MRPPGPAKTAYPQPQPSRPMQSSATLPISSRRQSYQPSSMSPRDFQPRHQPFSPTPTTSQVHLHTPSPLSQASTPQQQQTHTIPPAAPVTNPQQSPNPPPVETHHNTPNRVTEDVASVNLASIGFSMVMSEDDSDEDEESEESTSPAPSQPSTTPDGRVHAQPKSVSISKTAVLRKSSPERSQQENSRIVTTQQEGTSSSVSLVTPPRKLPWRKCLICQQKALLHTLLRPTKSSPRNLVILFLINPRLRVLSRGWVLPSHIVRRLPGTRTHRRHLYQCKLRPELYRSRISLPSDLTFLKAIPPLETVQNVLVLRMATAFTLLFLAKRRHHVAPGHRLLVVFRNVLSCPLLLPNPVEVRFNIRIVHPWPSCHLGVQPGRVCLILHLAQF
jgi:hypothetical protein